MVVDRHKRSIMLTSQASPLEPIFGRGGAPVVEHREWVLLQDRCYPSASRIPIVGRVLEDNAMIMPMEAVDAGCVLGDHGILLPWLAERMTADPHLPTLHVFDDHRILDRPLIITCKHRVAITKWQVLWPRPVQCINPPVLGVWGGTAEIETPAKISRQDHRALKGGGPERLTTHLADRLEIDSVARLSDNDADSAARVERPA